MELIPLRAIARVFARVPGRRHVDAGLDGWAGYAHCPLNHALQYAPPHSTALQLGSAEQRSLHASQSPFDQSRYAQSTFSVKSSELHAFCSHSQETLAAITSTMNTTCGVFNAELHHCVFRGLRRPLCGAHFA
jgi:hypothetical protein